MCGDPLGTALLHAAPLGLTGVFLLALAERIIPLLPSSGLFVAIGVAAAEGLWGLGVAVAASVLGSGTGAFSAYRAGTALGSGSNVRVRRTLRRRDRIGRLLRTARRSAATFPFIAQLLPATRILSPLVGGAVSRDQRRFVGATIAGLTLWNAGFICLGFAATRLGASANATAVSLAATGMGAGAALTVRLARKRHRRSRVSPRGRPFDLQGAFRPCRRS